MTSCLVMSTSGHRQYLKLKHLWKELSKSQYAIPLPGMCIFYFQPVSLDFKKDGRGYAEEHRWRIQLWEIQLHVSPNRFFEQRSPIRGCLGRDHAVVGSRRCNTMDHCYWESCIVDHAVMSTTWLESYSSPRIFKGPRERTGLLLGLQSFCSRHSRYIRPA